MLKNWKKNYKNKEELIKKDEPKKKEEKEENIENIEKFEIKFSDLSKEMESNKN